MIKLFSLKQQKKNDEASGTTSAGRRKASAAQLRITKDLNELQLPSTCSTIFPDPNELLNFKLIIAPDEGFYKNGKFTFTFKVGQAYPHEPPKVKCETMVYHPNIDLEGNVCLNILREDWKPVLTINSVIYGLQYLFLEPNPDDPLNKEAAEMLTKNKRVFEQNVNKSMRGGYVGNFARIMSRRKKTQETPTSKTSILSYFSASNDTNESPSKKFQKKPLKSKNQNDNNNKSLKRKTGERSNCVSQRKKQKVVNHDPIVISSDESEEGDNFYSKKAKNETTVLFPVVKAEKAKKSKNYDESPTIVIKNLLPSNSETLYNDFLDDNERLSKVKGSLVEAIQKDENSTITSEHSKTNFTDDLNADVETLSYHLTSNETLKIPAGNIQVEYDLKEKISMNACEQSRKMSKCDLGANSTDNSSPYGSASNGVNHFSNSIQPGTSTVVGVLDNEQQSADSDDQNTEQIAGEKIAYYLLNFRQILDTVLENEDDRTLFEGTDDMTWIDKFNKLPLAAQKLYVRLYHRKPAWLRLDQVNYPDISGNISRVLEVLSEEGFLLWFDQHDAAHDLDLRDILKLLPAPTLKNLAKSFQINVNGRQKNQISDDLLKMCKKQKSIMSGFFAKKSPRKNQKVGLLNNVMKRACKALGPCYKVASYPRTVFNRVLLVFDVTRGIDDETECSLTGSQNALGQGRHLQLSAILMAGMGKVSYPTCEVHRPTPIFSQRKDLLHYETAFQFQTDVLACVEAGQWEEAATLCDSANSIRKDIELNDKDSCQHAISLPEYLRCFTAHWTYKRLRSLEVEILQRRKDYRKAVDILRELLDQRTYCTSRRGHWWERLALNIDQHLKDPLQSLDVIHESLQDTEVRVGHKLALAQRVSKILTSKSVKKLSQLMTTYKTKLKPAIDRLKIKEPSVVEITGRLLPSDVQTGKSRFIATENGDGDANTESTFLCSVEELSLEHYKGLGYDHGIHGEGGTFSTLFSLFMWDIIFMRGIPDVFRTAYQTHPLDYHTDGFYLRRQDEIEKRLKLIEDLREEDFASQEQEDESDSGRSSAIDILSLTWDMEFGKSCAGMNWERFTSLDEAKGLVECIGGKVLSGIFRRLAKDLRHTRSGLPDLVVWNPVEKIYKMVEVKGPGDRLSTNQKLWIDALIGLCANVEVCKVIAIGGRKLTRY